MFGTPPNCAAVKFKEDRPYADAAAGVRKLPELANAMNPDHAGRIQISVLNWQFNQAGGDYVEYGEAMCAAIVQGYLPMHPSEGYDVHTGRGRPV
jgi:hypothetical protein